MRPTLAQVPSFVRPVAARTQVYAPAQNENVYTNLWRRPYFGFRRVIDYFQFTETPRRLKPIGIYYHFFSGTKAAAIKALHDVYAWAGEQQTFPVWASEYAAGVRGFESATLARRSTAPGWFATWARSRRCVCRPRSAGRIRQVRGCGRRAQSPPGALRHPGPGPPRRAGAVPRSPPRPLCPCLERRRRFVPPPGGGHDTISSPRAHARRGRDRRLRWIHFRQAGPSRTGCRRHRQGSERSVPWTRYGRTRCLMSLKRRCLLLLCAAPA